MKRTPAKGTKVRRNPPPQPRRSRHAPGAETLAAAALVVHEVIHEGRSADAALEASHERVDRAAVRAIALGTLRWYLRLKPALAPLVNRPFDELSPRLAALLVTAAHQVEYSRGAAEAQVHLAVDASRVVGEGRASGVVNAVLRRFVAQRAELLAARRRRPGAAACAPALAGGRARSRPGESAPQQILAANNEHPPMVLRVDPGAAARRGFPALVARAWAATPASSNGMPTPWCWSGPWPCRSLPGLRFRRSVGAGRRRATRRAAARCASRHAGARCLRGAGRQDPAHRAAHARLSPSWSRSTTIPRASAGFAKISSVRGAMPCC